MAAPITKSRSVGEAILAASPVLTALGLVGLLFIGVIGFEEPDGLLLLLSSLFLLCGPLVVFGHLAVTSELTIIEKKAWMRLFLGRRAPSGT